MEENKQIFADLHIHSRYSRACSKDITIENLVKWAKIKGLGLLGTGDFTHPFWLKDIKEKLVEKQGLYYLGDFPFILTGEISLMYSQGGKGRRVHLVLLVPSLEVVDKINAYFDTKGRRDYDGRPIFKISCEEFTREMMKISQDIEIIPAHCILPHTLIQLENEVKMIKNINRGDKVLTHKGIFKKVKEVVVHPYSGKVFKIIPWYFQEGLITTPEHPFYAIKSYKNCLSTKGLCKPLCSQVKKGCARKYFKDYSAKWIMAKDIEVGDFLVYPKIKEEKDIFEIDLANYIKDFKQINNNFFIHKNARNHTGKIKRKIIVNEKFCRLLGYFLSEGYLIKDSAIGFSFNSKEKEYINEVILAIKEIFGFNITQLDSRRKNQADIIFSSKLLNSFFSNFYLNGKKASSKSLPSEFSMLPKNKIAEIFRGWWRGDTGITVSRQLANQMKLICLRLGIIPSIYIYKSEDFNKGEHFIGNRRIISKSDTLIFNNLSFFEEDYEMLKENCFKKSINKINRKHGWVDESYVYLPVRKIQLDDYSGEVYNLEVEDDNSYISEFACIHNCMTPWFGIFGSITGFDSLKEAFGEEEKNIHAIETGMSASPEMLWHLSFLNNKAIVSFSDSHSFWPWRIGREATIFLKVESYNDIVSAIRENKILGTIETEPAYGKYHWDGHANCNFSCSPEECKKLNNICPVCHRPLTIGVENRIEKLTDQDIEKNPNRKKYYKLLPLHELIALAKASTLASRKTWLVYNNLIEKFGNEFNILLNIPETELMKALPNDNLLVELILENREGKIKVKPGYDGTYGIPLLKEKQEKLF